MEEEYTYYKLELLNSPLDWDETICEDLDQVRDILQFLDIYLDDPSLDLKVTIRGIGLTRSQYADFLAKYEADNAE